MVSMSPGALQCSAMKVTPEGIPARSRSIGLIRFGARYARRHAEMVDDGQVAGRQGVHGSGIKSRIDLAERSTPA